MIAIECFVRATGSELTRLTVKGSLLTALPGGLRAIQLACALTWPKRLRLGSDSAISTQKYPGICSALCVFSYQLSKWHKEGAILSVTPLYRLRVQSEIGSLLDANLAKCVSFSFCQPLKSPIHTAHRAADFPLTWTIQESGPEPSRAAGVSYCGNLSNIHQPGISESPRRTYGARKAIGIQIGRDLFPCVLSCLRTEHQRFISSGVASYSELKSNELFKRPCVFFTRSRRQIKHVFSRTFAKFNRWKSREFQQVKSFYGSHISFSLVRLLNARCASLGLGQGPRMIFIKEGKYSLRRVDCFSFGLSWAGRVLARAIAIDQKLH